MDFFDIAKQMEVDSQEFYSAQASQAAIPVIANWR